MKALYWKLSFVSIIVTLPLFVHGQSPTVTSDVYEKARVVDISVEASETIPDSSATAPVQSITAEITDGPDAGQTVTFDNDYVQLTSGETFYIRKTANGDGTYAWSVANPYRLNVLLVLFVIFVLLIFAFGGMPGVRGLASLAGGIILIFYFFLPGLYHGYSPVLLSLGIATVIIVLGSYITHGFNRTTNAAVISMILTVLVTGALAYASIHAAHLTGYESEESSYVTVATNGTIDMVGLLFGSIMIGLLGVLYDISIGQAVAVEELSSLADPANDEHRDHVYAKALRIGREHIGALVNTLAIAYVGASLPLLLLAKNSGLGIAYTVNSEVFATEIIRILIGSIGLVLAVPITTYVAIRMLHGMPAGKQTGHTHRH